LHTLRHRLNGFGDYRQSHASHPNPRLIRDPKELLDEYDRKQGSMNQMFAPVGRGRGRGRGRGGGRGTGRLSQETNENRSQVAENREWGFE